MAQELPTVNFLTSEQSLGLITHSNRNASFDLRGDILPEQRLDTMFNGS